jgi:Aldo/keto reductase family
MRHEVDRAQRLRPAPERRFVCLKSRWLPPIADAGAGRDNGGMTEAFELPGGAGLGSAPMAGPGWHADWGPVDLDESVAAVRAALAAGVGWIDTAPLYGWGRAEELIGSALEGMAARPVVLTKCGDVRGPDGRPRDDHRASVLRADVQASLRRLRCPVIDVVQLHDPDPGTSIEESWQIAPCPSARSPWSSTCCCSSSL